MKESIIQLDDIKKYYQMGNSTVKALDGVTLSINKGDFIAIVGPSGSGKSTMMNMVGALDLPTHGEIYLDNQDIAHLDESHLAQIRGSKIGFVFQTFNLIPTLTAIENIALPMIFHGVSKDERMERAEKIISQVQLEHRKKHFPGELSGGERQRVAIGRALANNPEVILADEPTGNLDSKTREEIMKLFVELNKQGRTIILVTHDLSITKFANKVIRLRDGKIEKNKAY